MPIVNLFVPFREFSYYNSKQQGSASIKDVLPAITRKKATKAWKLAMAEQHLLSFIICVIIMEKMLEKLY